MCSWEVVGEDLDIINALLTIICVLSLSGVLSETILTGGAVGFGRALIALCMS